MDLAPLTSFLAIAREGHLTRAARALHLSQPAVSAQLAKLEDDLGTALFHRTPKGMELTEAGELFQAYAEQSLLFLEDGRQALDALKGLRAGTLSVGGGATATTYLLPPLLRRFHEAYPAVRLYVREQGSAVRRVIDAALETAGVEAEIVMELRSIESIKQMVAQGIGSAFVSRFALSGPRSGLVPMEGADQLVRELAVIRRADRRPSVASHAFLGLMG